jgi:hypothetical protein
MLEMPEKNASQKMYQKKWYEENREKVLKYRKEYYLKHKERMDLKSKKYREENREKLKGYFKNHYKENKSRMTGFKNEIRMTVLKHYGGTPPKCACCGESHLEFLAIDHIGGGGLKEREALKRRAGTPFYRWMIRQKFPSGYQVLCHNCNMAKGLYGRCPHQLSGHPRRVNVLGRKNA